MCSSPCDVLDHFRIEIKRYLMEIIWKKVTAQYNIEVIVS